MVKTSTLRLQLAQHKLKYSDLSVISLDLDWIVCQLMVQHVTNTHKCSYPWFFQAHERNMTITCIHQTTTVTQLFHKCIPWNYILFLFYWHAKPWTFQYIPLYDRNSTRLQLLIWCVLWSRKYGICLFLNWLCFIPTLSLYQWISLLYDWAVFTITQGFKTLQINIWTYMEQLNFTQVKYCVLSI